MFCAFSLTEINCHTFPTFSALASSSKYSFHWNDLWSISIFKLHFQVMAINYLLRNSLRVCARIINIITIDFLMFVKRLLIIPDRSIKKNQKFSEFIMLMKITENHSPVLQVVKIRLALLFRLSLIIWQLCPTSSHEYCCLIDRSKLYSSTNNQGKYLNAE